MLGGDWDIARGGERAAAAAMGGRCTEQRKTGEGGRVEWAGPRGEDKDARGNGGLFT